MNIVLQQNVVLREVSMKAIEAHGLEKTYAGDVRALDGMSFSVEPGTIFALLGRNGAGKSTTVKILTTLSRPDEVRHAIGVVAQRSGVDRDATGRENLTLQGQLYGLRGQVLRQRVSELLERFGLAEAGGRIARGYSGGMQRRLEVAMGLVHRPDVLFLDEPTTGLDPEARTFMWGEIGRLAVNEHLTILLTTHYLEEAERLAERVAIVDRGRIVVEGTPESLKGELRGDAIHVGLGEPEANGRVHAALERVPGIRELVLDGQSLRARADNGAAAIPSVLGALDAAGVPVTAATVSRPSLDDVYLRYVGRAFDEAGDDTKEVN
jgi:ABC-2 type transport system ATP-binding protein